MDALQQRYLVKMPICQEPGFWEKIVSRFHRPPGAIFYCIYKVDRCLARYSPHAEANNGTMQNDTVQYNATSCNTMQYQCNTIRYTNAIP